MRKIGIFGGTFNPVHNGHIRLLERVSETVGFDKIIVLPDRIPPHKEACELADGCHRLETCRMAFGDVSGVEVSDWELNQSGKSYSVLTLRHFHEIYPDDKLFFIMGSDMLLCFHKWYCYEEILSLASLVCISREDEISQKELTDYAQKLTEKNGEVIVLDVKPFEVSSSMIREMIKKSEDISCYLPKKIVQYIYDKNLYR